MSNTSPVAFVIGGGPRIGYALADTFSKRGYKVAIGSRNPNKEEVYSRGWLAVKVDVTDIATIKRGFQTVQLELGPPNVVIYNAAALTFTEPNDPFGLSPEQFNSTLGVNLTGAYACLHETVAGFKSIQSDQTSGKKLPKLFVATGNVVPFQPMPLAITLGAGKAGLAHLIEAGSIAYESEGYKFYFVSQVTKDGGPVAFEEVDAGAHGKQYVELLEGKSDKNSGWDVRFVA